jgi:tetratricopeptide (TPR) repeat protein
MAFFERFRVETRRYADGVHELGRPAHAQAIASAERRLGCALPGELGKLYQSWDGMRLFLDTVVIEPLTQLVADGSWLRIGEWPDGALYLDERGRVWSRSEGERAQLVGSSLERFLAALMAREGLLIDREGEFRDVFEEEEIRLPVRQKRVRAAIKADPEAAAWQREAAELAFEAGDDAAAAAALARALELDDEDAEGWQLYGSLKRRSGLSREAIACFERASQTTPSGDHGSRAERAAEAARAAVEAGDESARARNAAQALAVDAEAPARYLEAARERLGEGDADGALNLAALADAVAPGGEAAALVRQARVRSKLRTLT